jgi:hypothetical protein
MSFRFLFAFFSLRTEYVSRPFYSLLIMDSFTFKRTPHVTFFICERFLLIKSDIFVVLFHQQAELFETGSGSHGNGHGQHPERSDPPYKGRECR